MKADRFLRLHLPHAMLWVAISKYQRHAREIVCQKDKLAAAVPARMAE
jgi:hypothetical protein